jgi:hypothetical protein
MSATMSQTFIFTSIIKPLQSKTTLRTSKVTSNTTTHVVLHGDVHMLLKFCGCPKGHLRKRSYSLETWQQRHPRYSFNVRIGLWTRSCRITDAPNGTFHNVMDVALDVTIAAGKQHTCSVLHQMKQMRTPSCTNS